MSANFQIGDKVRENRSGSTTETVIAIHGNTLVTDAPLHNLLHTSKAVKAEAM